MNNEVEVNDNERFKADIDRVLTKLRDLANFVKIHGEELSDESLLELDELTTDVKLLAAQLDGAARTIRRREIDAPVAGSDIDERVSRYVADLAQAGAPLVRGFGPGEQLQVHFAESAAWSNRRTEKGFVRNSANPLLLAARLLPQQLAQSILAEITALTQDQDQRPPRIAALEQQCAQLRRLEEAAVMKALARGEAVTRDVAAPPEAILEVRIRAEERARHPKLTQPAAPARAPNFSPTPTEVVVGGSDAVAAIVGDKESHPQAGAGQVESDRV